MRIERILANNPGPYTGPGTNTWLIGDETGRVAGSQPVGVIVTHTHPDHAPMANPLARELGVPAYGHAPGPSFEPDVVLADDSTVDIGDARLEVIHTPGHSDDHLCFRVGSVLFTGDHIMGGSSVMVEDMGSYLQSLRRLLGSGLTRLHPGHGEEMEDPDRVIEWYLAHRLQRHEQIYEAIRAGATSTPEIVEMVYADVDSALHPLGARSVEAHLVLLAEQGRIALSGDGARMAPAEPS